MNGDTNRPGLIGDGPGDGLADPPGRIGAELIAALVFEFIHRFHQPDIPLLDQVQELQAPVGIFFGDGDHQTQVGLDQLIFGQLGLRFPVLDCLQGAFQLLHGQVGLRFHPADLPLGVADHPVIFLQLLPLQAGLAEDLAEFSGLFLHQAEKTLKLIKGQVRPVLAPR